MYERKDVGDVGLASRSHKSVKKKGARCSPTSEQIKAAMVQVFVTTELLSDESRAATSDEAAARRDETLGSFQFGKRTEESANRTANSRWHSASAGCGS